MRYGRDSWHRPYGELRRPGDRGDDEEADGQRQRADHRQRGVPSDVRGREAEDQRKDGDRQKEHWLAVPAAPQDGEAVFPTKAALLLFVTCLATPLALIGFVTGVLLSRRRRAPR
jgi:hypothetical protein